MPRPYGSFLWVALLPMAVMVAACGGGDGGGHWSAPEMLGATDTCSLEPGGFPLEPSLDVAPSGQMLAAWWDDRRGLVAARHEATGWRQAPVSAEARRGGNCSPPHIALAESGDAFAYVPDAPLFFRSTSSTPWFAEETLVEGDHGARLAVESGGTAFALWSHSTLDGWGHEVPQAATYSPGKGWKGVGGPSVPVADSVYGLIARADGRGGFFVAWTSKYTTSPSDWWARSWVTRYAPETGWEPPFELEDGAWDLAVLDPGVAVITWADEEGAHVRRHHPSFGWGPRETLPVGPAPIFLGLAAGSGQAAVAWGAESAGGRQIFVARTIAGGPFSPPERCNLSFEYVLGSALAMSGDGHVLFAGFDHKASSRSPLRDSLSVVHQSSPSSPWTEPEVIRRVAKGGPLKVGIDDSNNVTILWAEGNSGTTGVWVTRTTLR